MLTLEKHLELSGEFVIFAVGDDEGVHSQHVDSNDKKRRPF